MFAAPAARGVGGRLVIDMPAQLLADLSPPDVRAAEAWWAGPTEASRAEVVALWDERQDACLFGLAPFRDGVPPPTVLGGRFVPREDDAAGWAEWRAEYLDHLMNHPERLSFEPIRPRTFHIGCTSHPAARAVLATGHVPAGFRCPLDEVGCPVGRLARAASHLGTP